jgi:hypothetical protein
VVQKPIFGDEHGKRLKAVGTRGIGIWVVPAVTCCSHGPRAREIAGWAGYHRSYAKSRLNSAAATLSRGAGFPWRYHHYAPRYSHIHMGGFAWPDLAGASAEVLASGVNGVSHKWKLGRTGRPVDAWVQLKVISPEQRLSNKVPVHSSCVK